MSRKKTAPSISCPCCSGQAYRDCCAPIIEGTRPATTAEALMRSRFSAFALGKEDWLMASWHPDTCPPLPLLNEPPLKWLDLKILSHEQTSSESAHVEFIARFRAGGRAGKLHERSRFQKVDAHWVYVDGDIKES